MISRVFKILTLIAFVTHALLGCCVHHLHDVSSCGHSHLQHLTICEHDHDEEDHDADHRADSSECKLTPIADIEIADDEIVLVDHSSDNPCEDSEGCNHERCSFLTHSDSKSVGKSIGPIAFVAPLAASLCRSRLLVQGHNDALRLSRVNSPPLLCALQQSWQI